MMTGSSWPCWGPLLLLLLSLQTTASAGGRPGFCPIQRRLSTRTLCVDCKRSVFLLSCPSGYKSAGMKMQDCTRSFSFLPGCSKECYREVEEQWCCPGYWGPDCMECPERAEQPCNANGVCSDGMGGNGTCSCQDGFAGTACEDCSPNRYGPDCLSECRCVHGVCNSGLRQDGSCTCFSGYKGPACDQELPDCVALSCGLNSVCREGAATGRLGCQCAVGYQQSGDKCISINPCLQQPCHALAACAHTGPAQHVCACPFGHEGDGRVCSPVDPCQKDQAGCSAQTARCVYDGPGASHCECLPGFHELDHALRCHLKDVCTPDACHEKANCTTIQPGVAQCTCPKGYLGNGKVCYGSIMQRLRDLNTEPGGQWTGQLTDALTLFGSVSWPLENLGPFTVFVPINRAFRFSPSKSLVVDAVKAKYLCNLHMVAGTMPRDSLRRADVYYTLTGKAGEIDRASTEAQSKIRLRGSKNKVVILEPDVIASNGMIHLVNKLMENIPPTVDSDMQENLMTVISYNGKFSKFKSLLERASLSPLMDSPGPYTVFIPTNNAFSAMEDGQLEYLTTDEGHGKLVELVRNHVVESSRLEIYNVVSSPRVSSMANQVLLFNVSEKGRVSVNGMVILEADVETRNGQLYSLDGVLIPASVLPILPHRCDVSQSRVVKGQCGSCSRPSRVQCPSGDSLGMTFGCIYNYKLHSRSLTLPLSGCAPRCNTTIVRRACCPGFYSADCRPCPGGFQNPCSGYGQCMEGLQGNGTCVCRPGFRGSRCHYCTLSNKYGPGCSRTCPCLQGTCDNRPDSDGRCRPDSCLPGYTGARCERHTQACGPHVHFCHANADCDFSQGPAQCVCKPGYQGDGITCAERDPCAAPSRGGCGRNAKCIKTGPNAHVCKCLAGWALDQDECQPINDCNGPGRGGCHGNASCIYIGPGQSDCMCKTGYQGNGIDCEPANLCVVQNGRGCHYQARCQFVSGQWGCVCEDGYTGDGEVCYGTVEQELIAIPDASEFLSWVTAADLGQSLSEQNLTLLVPTSAAIQSLAADDKSFWTTKGNLASMIRNHVIQGIYTLSRLMASTSPVTSLLNTPFSVAETSQAVTIGGAAITLANVAATNGLIHVIDKVLVPERTRSEGLLEVLALRPEFSLFRAALIQHNLTDEIEQAEEYTIFAPIDSAVRDYLRATSANVLDVNTTRYHVLLSERLLKTELKAAGYKKTMLGFSYRLAIFPRDGKLLVNSAQLNVSNLLTANGVVHGLASVLEINRNRCDTILVDTKFSCMDCLAPQCPRGAAPKKIMPVIGCMMPRIFEGQLILAFGCKAICVQSVELLRCCAGFFGEHCEPCPGYDGRVCAGQGVCDEGTNGTGRCACRPFFDGTACESCVAGKYGVHCDQDCLCQSGRCMDGPLGDGTCVCEVGWKGIHCDEKVDSGADELCGAGKCHTSANCITKMSQTQCVCAAGFEGNGTDCRAIDACRGANGHCSPHAVCKRTQPGRRDCVCLPGYQGDGLVCVEIDACAQGTGHCHENADCIHSGPNKTVCVCQQGYSGDGQVCQMIDMCLKENGHCHRHARCNTTAPGVRTCTCGQGYVGDGSTCKGNLREEMFMKHCVEFLINMALALPGFSLNGRGPFTVFPPNSLMSAAGFKAMRALLDRGETDSVGYILQSHIVMGHLLTASDLAMPRNLTSLSGEVLTTGGSQGSILINEAKVTYSDEASLNGIIHEIDSFLVSPSVKRESHTASPLNLTDVAGRNGYKSFYKLMKETGVMDRLDDALLPVTVFLPSDRAWSSLSQQQRDFLYDPHNREQLLEYVRYHVVPYRQLFSPELGHLETARSMQGSLLRFSGGGPDAIGELFVNEGKCRVVQRNMAFRGGVAHGIDCMLTPPSLGGRCDEHTSFELKMSCASCRSSSKECPSGSKKKDLQTCDLPLLSYLEHSGCQPTCIFNHWQPRCCAGYYGRDCQACPGGAGSVCSNHGDCDDGHLGNGTCSCHDGFQGVACELCDDGRFGPACQACNCSQRGACLDGRRGSGACFCEEGWTGAHCEVQQAAVPVCTPPCSPQGVCQDKNTCTCAPFYQGNGSTCTLVDLCAAGNGGCAAGARCRQTGVKVGCVCPAGHSGDGFYCQPIDPCSLTDNGGCHEHATCTMTGPGKKKCACKNNYIGDGVKCEVKELLINRCLQDNGACHLDGECTDLHFEDATVGVFHLRSDKGPYKLTYGGAAAACGGQGASLASYTQLSYAQMAGFNLCSAGWLTEARVAYPTTFSNPNCGFGHVGIVDYGTRKNLSETWDAFCYRVKEVSCVCKPGYVGDGYSCSGNLLQVLESTPDFSNFFTQILNYSRSSRSGKEFVSRLSDLSTNNTLFVPDNSGLLENQTLTERDMEHHLSEGEALALSQMKNGSRLRTRQGSLTIQGLVDFMNPDALSSCYVNDRFIIDSDVVASNGVIHVIAGPLKAPKLLHVGHKAGMGVGLVLLLLALAAAALVVGYRFHTHRAKPFKFSYFKDEGEQEEDSAPTPTHSNIINPLFDTSPPTEPSPPSATDEDSQQEVSNVCYDIIQA